MLVSASRRNRLFLLFNSETKVRDGEDALARHAGRVRYPGETIRNRIRIPVRNLPME